MIHHPQDYVGKKVGPYIIRAFIAKGAFGFVLKAEHEVMGKTVAIKMLLPEKCGSVEYREAFKKEAIIVGSLEHPNILPVTDCGTRYEVPFLIMPFVERGNLSAHIPLGTILGLDIVVKYVKEIASALQYAHEKKLVHRDLKPANILVGAYGLLLTDFGIAVNAHSERSLSVQNGWGTPAYMAPEQFMQKAQITSDIYSLGVITYQWLTGRLPFTAEEDYAYYFQHLNAPIPYMGIEGVSWDVENVVRTALAKDPKDRFQSAAAFAKALEEAMTTPEIIDESTLIKERVVESVAVEQSDAQPLEDDRLDTLIEMIAAKVVEALEAKYPVLSQPVAPQPPAQVVFPERQEVTVYSENGTTLPIRSGEMMGYLRCDEGIEKGHTFELSDGTYTIGQSFECNLLFSDVVKEYSRISIRKAGEGKYLLESGAKPGHSKITTVKINGSFLRVEKKYPLRHGDKIENQSGDQYTFFLLHDGPPQVMPKVSTVEPLRKTPVIVREECTCGAWDPHRGDRPCSACEAKQNNVWIRQE